MEKSCSTQAIADLQEKQAGVAADEARPAGDQDRAAERHGVRKPEGSRDRVERSGTGTVRLLARPEAFRARWAVEGQLPHRFKAHHAPT